MLPCLWSVCGGRLESDGTGGDGTGGGTGGSLPFSASHGLAQTSAGSGGGGLLAPGGMIHAKLVASTAPSRACHALAALASGTGP